MLDEFSRHIGNNIDELATADKLNILRNYGRIDDVTNEELLLLIKGVDEVELSSLSSKVQNRINDAIRGGSKTLSNSQIDDIVRKSVHNSNSNSIRLGRYDQGYIDDAIEAGDSYFSTPEDVWNEIMHLGDDEIWKVNQKIIDDAISQGKTIKISQKPDDWVKSSTFFGKELRYLESLGYKFDKDAVGGYWYAYK